MEPPPTPLPLGQRRRLHDRRGLEAPAVGRCTTTQTHTCASAPRADVVRLAAHDNPRRRDSRNALFCRCLVARAHAQGTAPYRGNVPAFPKLHAPPRLQLPVEQAHILQPRGRVSCHSDQAPTRGVGGKRKRGLTDCLVAPVERPAHGACEAHTPPCSRTAPHHCASNNPVPSVNESEPGCSSSRCAHTNACSMTPSVATHRARERPRRIHTLLCAYRG